MPYDHLTGKVAIVTGGASGIGKATSILLAEHGARVAVLDRDVENATTVAKHIESAGAEALAVEVDLARTASIPGAVEAVRSWGGRIDILVNSAGVTGGQASVLEVDEATWDLVQAVNVKALLVLTQLVARQMVAQGEGGRIVNLSSSVAFRGTQAPVHYASSKAAVSAITRVAAGELGVHDINVNAVAPGVTKTPMTKGLGNDEAYVRVVSEGPLANFLHRPSEPEDVAEVIVFLCLPASRQITGQTVHTSAGLVL
jgi:NAD(P)-dependent dehydrogenase (short-subunit alcohol dehydrogenase family)